VQQLLPFLVAQGREHVTQHEPDCCNDDERECVCVVCVCVCACVCVCEQNIHPKQTCYNLPRSRPPPLPPLPPNWCGVYYTGIELAGG
jgi:hypothetical protein